MKKPGKGEEQFSHIFLNSFFALIFPLGGWHLVDWELSKNNRDFMLSVCEHTWMCWIFCSSNYVCTPAGCSPKSV